MTDILLLQTKFGFYGLMVEQRMAEFVRRIDNRLGLFNKAQNLMFKKKAASQ